MTDTTSTMTDTTSTVRSAVGIGAITALSRLVGFVRVLVVAAVLGTTYLGNAFQSANSVSNVVFELVAAGALSAVLVPSFVDLLDRGDRRGAEEVAGGVLGVAVVGLGLVALIGMVAAPALAHLLTLGVPAAVAADQRALISLLLVFFLPQVVLYAAGAVATAVLHAERRFLVVAAAPMANTVVMVACLLAFRASTGGDTGLDLTTSERALLIVAGTGGVVAFTGVLVIACRSMGFRLVPRRTMGDPRVRAMLRLAGWGVVLHTSAGILLGGAIVAGAAVEGGVVAYQVAWVFFLAPYAVFSQPVQTAILPELVVESKVDGGRPYVASVRWALERIALALVPITAALVVLAAPAMRLVSFGEAAKGDGPELLAVALATLAIGLLPYGAFLLLARAYYALGDSRTPGQVSLVAAAVGAVVLVVGAPFTDGTGRIALLGVSHTAAYLVGAVVLVVVLQHRTGTRLLTTALWLQVVVGASVGALGWVASRAVSTTWSGRPADLVICMVTVAVGAAAMWLAYHVVGLKARLAPRVASASPAPSSVTGSRR